MISRIRGISKWHYSLNIHVTLIIFTLSAYTPVSTASVLEEVIVTAQKREQSLQDVGIAITAFSGAQLDTFGFVESTDVAAMTPGVHISGNNAGQTLQFTIRGATQNDFGDMAEAPNAVYVDEGYIATGQGQLFANFDMERVEVLKGPQGTLFGRNATGGLVHYITRKPTEQFEAFADVAYGSYNSVRAEGAISGPIAENLLGRVSVFMNRHDAILDNNFTAADLPATPAFLAAQGRTIQGSPSGAADGWDDDQWAARVQGLWKINDSTELLVKGHYTQQNPTSGPYQNVPTVGFVNANGDLVDTAFAKDVQTNCELISTVDGSCQNSVFDLDFDAVRPDPNGDFFGYVDEDGDGLDTKTDHLVSDYDEVKIYGTTARLTWDFSNGMTLTAVSNYAHQKKQQSLDVESGPTPQLVVVFESENEWFTQELRLNGETDRLRWVVGLYYLTVDADYNASIGDSIGGINPFGALFAGDVNLFLDAAITTLLETDSYSIFGQFDFDLTDKLILTAGIRGIREEKDFDYTSFLYVNIDDRTVDNEGTPLAPFLLPHSEDSGANLWTGKIQLGYHATDDLMFYFGVNRGVKAGSFNAPITTFLTPDQYGYDEEVLLAYEGGFKSTLFDGRVRLNGSAYYYDYSDYQGFQFMGTSGAIFNVDAVYKGFELELAANPIDNFDFMFGLSYIDPKVKDVNVAQNVPRDVEPSFTPKVQLSGLARYVWPQTLLGGDVAFQMDFNYADTAYSNINNFGTQKMDSYIIGNARLSWFSADDHWEMQFFVNNLADARNQLIGYEISTICGCDENSFGNPRWFGAKVRYNWF